jgi:hypothetical protein
MSGIWVLREDAYNNKDLYCSSGNSVVNSICRICSRKIEGPNQLCDKYGSNVIVTSHADLVEHILNSGYHVEAVQDSIIIDRD